MKNQIKSSQSVCLLFTMNYQVFWSWALFQPAVKRRKIMLSALNIIYILIWFMCSRQHCSTVKPLWVSEEMKVKEENKSNRGSCSTWLAESVIFVTIFQNDSLASAAATQSKALLSSGSCLHSRAMHLSYLHHIPYTLTVVHHKRDSCTPFSPMQYTFSF